MRAGRGNRAVGALLVVGISGAVLTASGQRADETNAPRSQVDRVENRRLAQALESEAGAYGEPTVARRLSGAKPIYRGPAGWQPLVGDAWEARARTLAARAERRAYDGAPPVMPHSRNFAKTKTCLECHETGIRLGERFGPPLSHPHLVSCLQCHVESRNVEVPASGGVVANAFDGLRAPAGAVRPWPGAPPVIPHTTFMRTDCLSCHGPTSYPGLRTDHPQRTNCVQCHAVAASLDQTAPFFSGDATLLRPQRLENAARPEDE
jgi:cytochrome c-type protein NapB